jgi:hypothetical protein
MPTIINCPTCERQLNVPGPLVGKAVKCPTCGETFIADPDCPPPRHPPEDVPAPELRMLDPGPTPPEEAIRSESDAVLEDRTFRLEPAAPPDDDPGGGTRGGKETRPEEEEPVREERLPRSGPQLVAEIGVLMLIGGFFAILHAIGLCHDVALARGIWPGTFASVLMGTGAVYCVVTGLVALVTGGRVLLGHRVEHPRWVAILMMLTVVTGDPVGLLLGVGVLYKLKESELLSHFRR